MIGAEVQMRLIAYRGHQSDARPLLTIAIPHYKHRRYLEIVLNSIFAQDFNDFDILVSDDCSPDDSVSHIPELLQSSGRPYQYYLQARNLGYDGNVRFCLRMARGRYVFLLGNDDALGLPTVLSQIAQALDQLRRPHVAYVEYEDWSTGSRANRALITSEVGSGLETALTVFRKFSFVSGLIFDRDSALQHETDRWDQSIYYQIYLATRIITSGGRVGSIAVSAVRKDVQVDGMGVPNYATKLKDIPWSLQSRHTGVDSVLRVTWDALKAEVPIAQHSKILSRLIKQIYTTLHPYWVMEYRRRANWSAGVGVARGHWPGKMLAEYPCLNTLDRLTLWGVYAVSTLGALLLPTALMGKLKQMLSRQPVVSAVGSDTTSS